MNFFTGNFASRLLVNEMQTEMVMSTETKDPHVLNICHFSHLHICFIIKSSLTAELNFFATINVSPHLQQQASPLYAEGFYNTVSSIYLLASCQFEYESLKNQCSL